MISPIFSEKPTHILYDVNPQTHNIRRYLNSLSLVSKQFLSITNRLRFSLAVRNPTHPLLGRLFKRFSNLTSLDLTSFDGDLDTLLYEISNFPSLNITSLDLSYQPTIPANGLQTFSQMITTLTSLTCSYIVNFNSSHMFLIAECFPMLEELNIVHTSCYDNKNYTSYCDGVEALSLALFKLRKVNLSRFPINNQLLFHLFKNCKLLQDVIMFCCDQITSAGIAYTLRERPTLRSLSFSSSPISLEFATSQFYDSMVSLKDLTCLRLRFLNISDDLLYSIARESLPLTRLVLGFCTCYSYAGIFCLLSKCQGL